MRPHSYERFRRKALGEEPAGYVRARSVAVGPTVAELTDASEEELWALHRRRSVSGAGSPGPEEAPLGEGRAPARGGAGGEARGASLLDLKLELARRLLGPCRLCFLRCPVDRRAGERGACGLGPGLRPYQDFVHLGEELELIPTHAFYLAGCSYRCVYCSDWAQVARPGEVGEVPAEVLARSVDARRREGARSLSWVGGSPDVNLPGILEVLALLRCSVPVVWNGNLSNTEEAHELLSGVVDAWVADLKYGCEECSRSGSGIAGALAVARRNLRRIAGEAYTVVRHLLLPGHLECCTLPVLDWLREEVPGVRVNLLDQYQAPGRLRGSPWDRAVVAADLARARSHAEDLGLDLAGPGPLPPSGGVAGAAESAGAAPAAGFSSALRLGSSGEVVVENLSPELAPLLEALGELTPELRARLRAGGAWRPAPGP
ncbi:MAG: radical SAM protein [Planctomycetota bacterium]|nr:MAG: radical SAM protein [Planctomycetota bacterium]